MTNQYPKFLPGKEYPNRAQRRKDVGINKKGLHKPKEGQKMILIYGVLKYLHFVQKVLIKNKYKQVIRFKKINHTVYKN